MAELVFPPQIESFSLGRATNLESYTIHLQMIKRWKEDPIISNSLITAAIQEYEARFEEFDQSYKLSQKSDLTPQIHEEDDARDNALSQFATILRAMAKSPMKSFADAATLLIDKFDFYGIDPRMQIDQENALILNWSRDMAEQRYVDALNLIGLKPVYDDLIERNARIMALLSARTEERSTRILQALKNARKACDECYRYLVMVTNAVIVTAPDPGLYTGFVQKIAAEIKYHRLNTLK